jgi:hypothetical protein
MVAGAYGIVAFLTFVRDNLLPPETRAAWDTFGLLPHWSLSQWLVGALAITLAGVIEVSFRLDRALRLDLGNALADLESQRNRMAELERQAAGLAHPRPLQNTPDIQTLGELEFRARQIAGPQVVKTELSVDLVEWSPTASPRKFHLLAVTNTGTEVAEGVRVLLISVSPLRDGADPNQLPAPLPDERGETGAHSIDQGKTEKYYVLQSWVAFAGLMVKGFDGDPGVGDKSYGPPTTLANGEGKVLHVRVSARNAPVINTTIQADCQGDMLLTLLWRE